MLYIQLHHHWLYHRTRPLTALAWLSYVHQGIVVPPQRPWGHFRPGRMGSPGTPPEEACGSPRRKAHTGGRSSSARICTPTCTRAVTFHKDSRVLHGQPGMLKGPLQNHKAAKWGARVRS